MRSRQRRSGRYGAANRAVEIGVQRIERLQALLGVGTRGHLRQRKPGIGPLQALDDLTQVIVALGKALRRLVGGAPGSQGHHIELQTLRAQIEALQRTATDVDIGSGQVADDRAHLCGEARNEIASLAGGIARVDQRAFGLAHRRRIAQKSCEAGVFRKRSIRIGRGDVFELLQLRLEARNGGLVTGHGPFRIHCDAIQCIHRGCLGARGRSRALLGEQQNGRDGQQQRRYR